MYDSCKMTIWTIYNILTNQVLLVDHPCFPPITVSGIFLLFSIHFFWICETFHLPLNIPEHRGSLVGKRVRVDTAVELLQAPRNCVQSALKIAWDDAAEADLVCVRASFVPVLLGRLRHRGGDLRRAAAGDHASRASSLAAQLPLPSSDGKKENGTSGFK